MKLNALFEPDENLDARILNLEKQLGAQLPEGYIAFLKQMNGASLAEGCNEDLEIQVPGGTYTDLNVLYGSGEWIYTAARLEFWLDNRPYPMSLLVGSDSGGNNFWISLRPEDYGTVHFWDKDEILADGQIAESWTEFLDF